MIKKIIYILILAALAIGGYWVYTNVFKNNVHLDGKKYTYIYVKTDATFQDVLDELYSQNIIDDHESFEWTARKMKLPDHIIPGKYRIDAKMSNRSIVKMLVNGKQEKVKLYFNSQIRTREQFITYISDKLEIEEHELEDYCNNETMLQEKFGLNADNFMALIVPENYEVSWTTHTEELFDLLKESYDELWNKERKAKAKALGYSIPEIVTLASIVQSESGIKSEQQKIAGVYINRLQKDMRLQADRLLLDVPCSGLGVLKRNPDAKWKLNPEFIERTKQLQQTILSEYSIMTKKGGMMVYSTCSILPSENRAQVDEFLKRHADFEMVHDQSVMPSEGFDGFYMALMKRK